jgi:hypothetical protein
MPCSWIKLPGGGVAIVKHSKMRAPKCRFCPARSTKLCDGLVGETLGGELITCDAPICNAHARRVGPDKDFCPDHHTPEDFVR